MILQPVSGETWWQYYERMSGAPVKAACRECSMLYMARVSEIQDLKRRAYLREAYIAHRAGCAMPLGSRP